MPEPRSIKEARRAHYAWIKSTTPEDRAQMTDLDRWVVAYQTGQIELLCEELRARSKERKDDGDAVPESRA